MLGLPHWGIAEEVLEVLLNRWAEKKAMAIDIVLSAFVGLVKWRQRVEDLGLTGDLHSSTPTAQAQEVGPDDELKRVLVNYLTNHESFAKPGAVCRDAVSYFKARWKSEEFWSAQARPISEQQGEVASLKLTLRSPLLSNVLPRGLNALLLGLLKDSAGADKAKVLRVVKDIAVVQPAVIPVAFLRRASSELLQDQNANVRTSVVELLSAICLSKLRQARDDSEIQETFDALSSRKFDISVKVRQAVEVFLYGVASLFRPKAPMLPFGLYPGLVGSHVNKHTGGCFLSGRVLSFDNKTAI